MFLHFNEASIETRKAIHYLEECVYLQSAFYTTCGSHKNHYNSWLIWWYSDNHEHHDPVKGHWFNWRRMFLIWKQNLWILKWAIAGWMACLNDILKQRSILCQFFRFYFLKNLINYKILYKRLNTKLSIKNVSKIWFNSISTKKR